MSKTKTVWVIVTTTASGATATICDHEPTLRIVNGGWITGSDTNAAPRDWPLDMVKGIYKSEMEVPA